jgi:SatD family protein
MRYSRVFCQSALITAARGPLRCGIVPGTHCLQICRLYENVQVRKLVRMRTSARKALSAVLLADIVSSRRRTNVRALLAERLRAVTQRHLRRSLIRLPYAVTAGDEFQVLCGALDEVPELVLDLRRCMRPFALRIGIGIGAVQGKIQIPVNRMEGEAFQFARRAIEALKQGDALKIEALTAFRSNRPVFDTTADLIYGLHDTLLIKVTEKQWKTIDQYTSKGRLETAGRALGVDFTTVSRNLKRSFYWQMEYTVRGMRKVIASQFS